MARSRAPALAVSLVFLAGASLQIGAVQIDPGEVITPTADMPKTALELVEKLETRHYSKRKFDDELSSLLLDNYLDSLDPSPQGKDSVGS